MSHDNHGHHHDTHNDKPNVEFKSAFYFVIILAGLFLASISFVQSMSHDEAGHDGGHGAQHSEAASHNSAATHETTTHEAAKNEESKNETEGHENAHSEVEHKEATPEAAHH
jgi:hypothetical protein